MPLALRGKTSSLMKISQLAQINGPSLLNWKLSTKPILFFTAVRNFYLSTLKKMLLKFPFGDSLLKDLGVLQPEKTSSYSARTILNLAKIFPQLEIADFESHDCLREEFWISLFYLQISQHIVCTTLQTAHQSLELDHCCGKSERCRQLTATKGFQSCVNIGLLCIHCSNADSERRFSVLTK